MVSAGSDYILSPRPLYGHVYCASIQLNTHIFDRFIAVKFLSDDDDS